MQRNESSPTSHAPAVIAFPVHRNGQTETEGSQRAKGFPQYQAISSKLAPGVPASGKSSMLRFLLVATLALVESLYYRGSNLSIMYLSAATCLLFVLLSLQSHRWGRTGALIALGLFAVSTTAMAVIAMTTEHGIALVVKPLIGRFVLLFVLYRGFELQDDLQVLQNSH